MKDKASVLSELERLNSVKNELTDEVTRLHGLLEQERSKVASLSEGLKHKDKVNIYIFTYIITLIHVVFIINMCTFRCMAYKFYNSIICVFCVINFFIYISEKQKACLVMFHFTVIICFYLFCVFAFHWTYTMFMSFRVRSNEDLFSYYI